MNNVEVFGLMALLTGLVVAVGGALGGQSGMPIAFVMAGAMNFLMYGTSSSMVLRMYGARAVDRHRAQAPRVPSGRAGKAAGGYPNGHGAGTQFWTQSRRRG